MKTNISRMLHLSAVVGALVGMAMLLSTTQVAAVEAGAVMPGDDIASKKISLNLDEKMLKDVFEVISLQVGVSIEAEPAIEGLRVSIKVRDVNWKHALDIICRKKKIAYQQIEPGFYYVTQAPQVKMKFQDADLKVVLELLAQQAGVNIIVAPEVVGKVSCYLNNVPWDAALTTIVKTQGYVVVKEDNNIMRVVTRSSLRDQLETRIFQLSYVRPPEDYRAIFAPGSTSGPGASASQFVERDPANRVERFTLLNALKAVLSKELGDLQYDLATNTIIVTDTKPKLDEMDRIVQQLDVSPTQVFLEVKFIRTTMNKLSERGIRFDLSDTPEEDGLFLKVDFPDPDSFTGYKGGTYEFDVGRWESIREDFNSIGIIDFTQSEILLRLIKSDEDTRIIQAPRIFTLNNQEATIFVGERVPYVAQKSQVDQSGNVVITIEEDPDSPVAVGFTLFVTPHVVKDSDEIMLTVIPKTSTLTGTSSIENPGFDRFSAILPGGAESFLDLPRTLDQIIVTKMLVRDGSTAVIGGLVSEDRREITSKIPFISSIPIIGNFFTWKRKVNRKENLIIFITPTIIRDRESSVRLSKRMLEIERELDHFWQTYQSSAIDFEAKNIDSVLKALAAKEEPIEAPEEEAEETSEEETPAEGSGEEVTPDPGTGYEEVPPEPAPVPDPFPEVEETPDNG